MRQEAAILLRDLRWRSCARLTGIPSMRMSGAAARLPTMRGISPRASLLPRSNGATSIRFEKNAAVSGLFFWRPCITTLRTTSHTGRH